MLLPLLPLLGGVFLINKAGNKAKNVISHGRREAIVLVAAVLVALGLLFMVILPLGLGTTKSAVSSSSQLSIGGPSVAMPSGGDSALGSLWELLLWPITTVFSLIIRVLWIVSAIILHVFQLVFTMAARVVLFILNLGSHVVSMLLDMAAILVMMLLTIAFRLLPFAAAGAGVFVLLRNLRVL